MKNILIIAGPSAVGKTTLAHELLTRASGFEFVRSVTTREPRGDSFDSEYIYINNKEFKDLIENGGVLEYTEYAGNFYGTPRSEIERIHIEGKTPLLILDLNGVHTAVNAENGFRACAVFVFAPESVLKKRLSLRYGEDIEKFESRIKQNKADLAKFEEIKSDFYAVIENTGNVGKSVSEIEKAFKKFSAR